HSSAVVYVVSFLLRIDHRPGSSPRSRETGIDGATPKGRLHAGARSVRLAPPVPPRPTARKVGPAPPPPSVLPLPCSSARGNDHGQRAVQPPSITSGAPVNTA